MTAAQFNAASPSGTRPIRLGDPAPNFVARTTMGERTLANYRGKWVIFFSHPADFTPVCTTEFVALAQAADRFAALDCSLIGLSVDSLFSHFAWLRAIREVFGVIIDFPVIEDPSMEIGRAYGMIDSDSHNSAAIRCTYFIDPDGIVRAITSYPHNVGRSVAEMLRMLAALQMAAGDQLLTPEGWVAGESLLLPPEVDQTVEHAQADWFCRRVQHP